VIDRDLLKRAGWSDELVAAAEQAIASVIDPVLEVELDAFGQVAVAGSQRLELDRTVPAGDIHLHII
jgi:hypothetical protein